MVVFSLYHTLSVQVGATQSTHNDHEAHLKHVLHGRPFRYALLGITLSKTLIAFSNPPASHVHRFQQSQLEKSAQDTC